MDGVFDTEALIGNSNTAHIEKTANEGEVVFMTDAELNKDGGQASALWSYEGARVDMRKPFSTEMYVYLGNSRLGAADGMTFTFHADDREEARTSALGKNGGALGVYGDIDIARKPTSGTTGWNKPQYGDTLDKFIQEGIQKSYTIEMDTNRNAVFDKTIGAKRQHIVAAYPAHEVITKYTKNIWNTWVAHYDGVQYKMQETGLFSGKYQPVMQSKTVTENPIFLGSDWNTGGGHG